MRPLAHVVALSLGLLLGPSAAHAQAQRRDSTEPVKLSPQTLLSLRQSFPDSARRRLLGSLQAGRARWAARGPRRYRLETRIGCFCTSVPQPGMPRWPVVEVRDGAIIRVRSAARPDIPESGWAATVEELFASAERELRDSTRAVSVLELDAEYGFPRRIHSDTPGVTDVWSHIEVRRFTPVR